VYPQVFKDKILSTSQGLAIHQFGMKGC
jgi:hypothetical protein